MPKKIKANKTNWRVEANDWRDKFASQTLELILARERIRDAKAQAWTPDDGIWVVSNNGSSKTKVAELSDEPIATIIGNLAAYVDVAASAMMQLTADAHRQARMVPAGYAGAGCYVSRYVSPSYYELALEALLAAAKAHSVRYPSTITQETRDMKKKKKGKKPPC